MAVAYGSAEWIAIKKAEKQKELQEAYEKESARRGMYGSTASLKNYEDALATAYAAIEDEAARINWQTSESEKAREHETELAEKGIKSSERQATWTGLGSLATQALFSKDQGTWGINPKTGKWEKSPQGKSLWDRGTKAIGKGLSTEWGKKEGKIPGFGSPYLTTGLGTGAGLMFGGPKTGTGALSGLGAGALIKSLFPGASNLWSTLASGLGSAFGSQKRSKGSQWMNWALPLLGILGMTGLFGSDIGGTGSGGIGTGGTGNRRNAMNMPNYGNFHYG